MPLPQIERLAKKAKVDIAKAEHAWEEAKMIADQKVGRSSKIYWGYVTSITKRKLGLTESLIPFLESTGEVSVFSCDDKNGNRLILRVNKSKSLVLLSTDDGTSLALSTIMFHESGTYEERDKKIHDLLLSVDSPTEMLKILNKSTGYKNWTVYSDE